MLVFARRKYTERRGITISERTMGVEPGNEATPGSPWVNHVPPLILNTITFQQRDYVIKTKLYSELTSEFLFLNCFY